MEMYTKQAKFVKVQRLEIGLHKIQNGRLPVGFPGDFFVELGMIHMRIKLLSEMAVRAISLKIFEIL